MASDDKRVKADPAQKNTLDAAPDRRSTVIELSSTYATGADRRQLT
jgi:hypothetical protein